MLRVFIPALLFQIYFLLSFSSFHIKYFLLLIHLSSPRVFLQTSSKKVFWPQCRGQVSLVTYFRTPCIYFRHCITLLQKTHFLCFHSYKLLEARVCVFSPAVLPFPESKMSMTWGILSHISGLLSLDLVLLHSVQTQWKL